MNENNQFDGYQQPVPERRSYSASDLGYQDSGSGLFKNPLIALLILVVTAGVFAGIIALTFSGGDAEDVLPVVRADNSVVKEEPVDRGGMDIPNAESTVFAHIDNAEGGTRIEDLFAGEAAQNVATAPSSENLTQISTDVLAEADALVQSIQAKASETVKTIDEMADKPQALHPAGSSPETLAFVRSVLEEKKNEIPATQDTAQPEPAPAPVKSVEKTEVKPVAAKPEVVAKAEPAAGVDGTHYVQMASIQDRARASGEWAKILDKYPALSGAGYRVQEKVIAGKGTFYRIQAGPFAKDVAVSKCEAVKAASGGCFLVAK